MSVNEVREKLGQLSARYPKDLLIIRSPDATDKVDFSNADMHGPFDNGDTDITDTLERALSAGKQAVVSAVGYQDVGLASSGTGSAEMNSFKLSALPFDDTCSAETTVPWITSTSRPASSAIS